jgi:hypothetical protein
LAGAGQRLQSRVCPRAVGVRGPWPPRSTETGAAHRAISTHTPLSIHPGPGPLPKLSPPWTRDARGRRPITGASGQQTGSRQPSSQSNRPEAAAGLTGAGNKSKGVGAVTFGEAPMPTTLRMGRTGTRGVHSGVGIRSATAGLHRCWAGTSLKAPAFTVCLTYVLSQQRLWRYARGSRPAVAHEVPNTASASCHTAGPGAARACSATNRVAAAISSGRRGPCSKDFGNHRNTNRARKPPAGSRSGSATTTPIQPRACIQEIRGSISPPPTKDELDHNQGKAYLSCV